MITQDWGDKDSDLHSYISHNRIYPPPHLGQFDISPKSKEVSHLFCNTTGSLRNADILEIKPIQNNVGGNTMKCQLQTFSKTGYP